MPGRGESKMAGNQRFRQLQGTFRALGYRSVWPRSCRGGFPRSHRLGSRCFQKTSSFKLSGPAVVFWSPLPERQPRDAHQVITRKYYKILLIVLASLGPALLAASPMRGRAAADNSGNILRRFEQLPQEFQAHLPDPRVAGAGHIAKLAAGEISVRVIELSVIEE